MQPKAARAAVFATLQSALEADAQPKDAAITAVIVAGTGDDCSGDICGEAERLHASFPNAKLSVLGIGMSEQAAANFTCAAKAMGGAFTAVRSGTDLDRLLHQTLDISATVKPVMASAAPRAAPVAQAAPQTPEAPAASTAPAAPAAAAPPPPAETKPAVQPAPRIEPNIVLSAVLAKGQPPLDAGVTWEIYKVITTPAGQLRQAESPSSAAAGGLAAFKLAEGRYVAKVTYGFAAAISEFTVGPGIHEKAISLEAGTIAAEAVQAEGSQTAEGAFFVLSRAKNDMQELVGKSSQVPAIFHVSAGEYVLTASAGLAKLTAIVKVEPGKVSVVRMVLNAGTLDIKTFATGSTPKSVQAWHMLYPAPAESTKRMAPPVLRMAGGVSRLLLPAGQYRLQTEYGSTHTESTISVVAGQAAWHNVVLRAGEAKISLPPGKSAKVCAVYEAGADRSAAPAGRAAGTSMSFILKAGSYDVECSAKGTGAPGKPIRVEVAAGETRETKIGE